MPSETAKVGAASEIITEAFLKGRPECRDWPLTDDLRVTVMYAHLGNEKVCFLSYDICEINTTQVKQFREVLSRELETRPEHIHIFCSHTHSSSVETEHDMSLLIERSCKAAKAAKSGAVPVEMVEFVRIDTGTKYNINRRTVKNDLGVWCLMQSHGCVDNGIAVDGTGWVRSNMESYGANQEEIANIKGPFLAARRNDPFLDLVLFPKASGGYAAGLVRFTAHAVVCSAGYWKHNIGRDYPGVLCDELATHCGCPILFLQGPCGDHRPRHRVVGIEERDRIGKGLASELIQQAGKFKQYPLDSLRNRGIRVKCRLAANFPHSLDECLRKEEKTKHQLEELGHGPDDLLKRKLLAEEKAYYSHVRSVMESKIYITSDEVAERAAELEIAHIRFGNVHVLTFEGELFSTVPRDLESAAGGPILVASFANGVTGYLMEREDYDEGGYEWTWALFKPEDISALRTAALELVEA